MSSLSAVLPHLEQRFESQRLVFWHDADGEHHHRERSSFVQSAGRWYFIDPTVPLKVGRNDACRKVQ